MYSSALKVQKLRWNSTGEKVGLKPDGYIPGPPTNHILQRHAKESDYKQLIFISKSDGPLYNLWTLIAQNKKGSDVINAVLPTHFSLGLKDVSKSREESIQIQKKKKKKTSFGGKILFWFTVNHTFNYGMISLF